MNTADIAVVVSGGLVAGVYANTDAPTINVSVIDLDTDDADESPIIEKEYDILMNLVEGGKAKAIW